MHKTIIIHIGSHKTATTFLQNTFTENAKALLQNGLLYPKTGLVHGAHHKLAWDLRDFSEESSDLMETPLWDDLVREIKSSDAAVALISSEDFEWSLKASALCGLSRDFDVKILFYIRQPDTYLESFYNQIVKDYPSMETRTIEEYISDESLFFLNPFSILKNWSNVFGVENCILRIFGSGRLINNSIIHDVLNAAELRCNIKMREPASDYLHKTSLPPDALEYLRITNSYLSRYDMHHDFVVRLVRMALRNRENLQQTRSGLLSLRSKRNILRRFAGPYRKACKVYLNMNENPFQPDQAEPHADFERRLPVGNADIIAKVATLIREYDNK